MDEHELMGKLKVSKAVAKMAVPSAKLMELLLCLLDKRSLKPPVFRTLFKLPENIIPGSEIKFLFL